MQISFGVEKEIESQASGTIKIFWFEGHKSRSHRSQKEVQNSAPKPFDGFPKFDNVDPTSVMAQFHFLLLFLILNCLLAWDSSIYCDGGNTPAMICIWHTKR